MPTAFRALLSFSLLCAGAGAVATSVAIAASAEARPPAQSPAPRVPSPERGRAIIMATRESLPAYVGNQLRCASCHLDAGTRPHAMPFTGVALRFPQYRSRSGKVDQLHDRVNDCFERSMAGRRLPVEGAAMQDILAYMDELSDNVLPGGRVAGQGVDSVPRPPLVPDSVRGRAVFAARCVSCHGADGLGTAAAPPLWGRGSFSIGAGMARIGTAAAFIRANMPLGAGRTLSPQEAWDVAAYLQHKPRPDFARKAEDWPKGDPPPDIPYATRAGRRPRPH